MMNSFQLKVLACIFMFIDHLGAIIYTDTDILRIIGRLSFPIFAFLMSEGYLHTKSVKKYMLRLLVFAIILQIPYSIATGEKTLNIFFTLFAGLLVVRIDDKVKNRILSIFLVGSVVFLANWLHVDYGYYGVLLIFVFKKFKDEFALLAIAFFILNLSVMNLYEFQYYSIFALLFTARYNGLRGFTSLWSKYGFYIFYPVHLLLIYGVSLLLK